MLASFVLALLVQNAYRAKRASFSPRILGSCPFGDDLPHVGSDMIGPMTLRERLERGYAMRAQRIVQGLLLSASFVLDDLRPAYVAFGLIALEVLTPLASPVTLLWLAFDRRVPPNRLGNLYYDAAGSRGAAVVSCVVLATAFAIVRWSALPMIGRILIGAPAASCLLSATVGFCAGCGHYVIARDLLVRAGLLGGTPEGACDVDVDGRQS
jgi:hypothetical protein